MNKYIIILSIYFLSFSLEAYDLNLIEGKSRKEIPKSMLKTIYKKYSTLPGYLYEYSPDKYYSLSKTGNAIGVFDLANIDDVLSGWPIKPSTQLLLKTEQETAGPTNPEVTNEGMYQPAKMWLEAGHENSSGCLSNTPLRYGDVNGDKLLFVFFDPSVVVFSPKRGKIDINLLFARDDVMPQAQYDEYIAESRFILKGVTVPQYAALTSIAEYRDEQLGKDWLSPAQRSYGKIYIDDFNGDTVNDIIMWRKLYFSRAKTDSVIGYKLDAEMYAHYQIVDGKYQLQLGTAPETIQGWLTAKNLTWQSGFPSKSECAGQEGKLIPEMHDPLLNDPDVLK